MTKPFIQLENITLAIHDEFLFQNSDWLWKSDENWAIIGPNGSGKSTLAKTICRQLPLFSGQIHYFFDPDLPQGQPFFERGEILMVSPSQHQELLRRYGSYHQARWQSSETDDIPTVKDYLSAKSIEHRSPFEVTPFKTDESVYLNRREKALALLEIEYLLERKIHQVSNGEARKMLIARALMQAPKLLIFDDPFGGLDTESRALLRKVLTEIVVAGATKILFVGSGPAELPEGITHVLSVAAHRIVAKKPITQVRTEKPEEAGLPMIPADIGILENQVKGFCTKSGNLTKDPTALVEMKNTSVRYNGVTVLSDITWTIREKERWAVLGQNGAGKSTLLSLIMADNPQSYANEIYLFGKKRGSGETIWDIKQHIGWVSPELQMYYVQGFTCLEVVCSGFFDSIGLYQNCSPQQTEAALAWLKLLHLETMSGHDFSTLSLGEQRLVLLARALVKNPALLVLDEPGQGLDKCHRNYINDLLDQICEQTGLGMIYVTHYLDELPRTITHVLRLKKGRIIQKEVRSGLK